MGYWGMLPGGVFGNGQPYFIGIHPICDVYHQVNAQGVVVNGRSADDAIQNYQFAADGMPHRVILPEELKSVYFRMNGANSDGRESLVAVPLATAMCDLPSDARVILLRTPKRGSVLVPPEGLEKLVE